MRTTYFLRVQPPPRPRAGYSSLRRQQPVYLCLPACLPFFVLLLLLPLIISSLCCSCCNFRLLTQFAKFLLLLLLLFCCCSLLAAFHFHYHLRVGGTTKSAKSYEINYNIYKFYANACHKQYVCVPASGCVCVCGREGCLGWGRFFTASRQLQTRALGTRQAHLGHNK